MIAHYIHENLAWVCVVEHSDKDYQALVTTTPTDLIQSMHSVSQKSVGKILYFRRFYDIASAEKHKLVLERISYNSLKSTIRKQNPEMEDLSEIFLAQTL